MKRTDPPISILSPAFHYVDSAHTDIRERFKLVRARQKLERMREADNQSHHDIFAARREHANVGTD